MALKYVPASTLVLFIEKSQHKFQRKNFLGKNWTHMSTKYKRKFWALLHVWSYYKTFKFIKTWVILPEKFAIVKIKCNSSLKALVSISEINSLLIANPKLSVFLSCTQLRGVSAVYLLFAASHAKVSHKPMQKLFKKCINCCVLWSRFSF